MSVTYNLSEVIRTCKGISREQLRKAVGDGQDTPPPQPIRFITGDRPEGDAGPPTPIRWPTGEPKFSISWETATTPDGDILGRLVWKLLGHEGTYPVVLDYVGEVPPQGVPTYFSEQEQAEEVSAQCAARLRDQFHLLFSETAD